MSNSDVVDYPRTSGRGGVGSVLTSLERFQLFDSGLSCHRRVPGGLPLSSSTPRTPEPRNDGTGARDPVVMVGDSGTTPSSYLV